MKDYSELASRFNDIQDLPISEELIGAYFENNLPENEYDDVSDIIESDEAVASLYNELAAPSEDEIFFPEQDMFSPDQVISDDASVAEPEDLLFSENEYNTYDNISLDFQDLADSENESLDVMGDSNQELPFLNDEEIDFLDSFSLPDIDQFTSDNGTDPQVLSTDDNGIFYLSETDSVIKEGIDGCMKPLEESVSLEDLYLYYNDDLPDNNSDADYGEDLLSDGGNDFLQ